MEKDKLYKKINKILGDKTPLKTDCGRLCSCACCKGDDNTGMHLFPEEKTSLPTKELEEGFRLAVCNGSCDRASRPLACKLFPFLPLVDEKGKVYVEIDYRAVRICPLLTSGAELDFDPKFFRAVKKAGKLLKKDKACLEFLEKTAEEIEFLKKIYVGDIT